MVELMILSFGGHESTYYAGMIIVYHFYFRLYSLIFDQNDNSSIDFDHVCYLSSTYLVFDQCYEYQDIYQ